jgi:hypothetical protein
MAARRLYLAKVNSDYQLVYRYVCLDDLSVLKNVFFFCCSFNPMLALKKLQGKRLLFVGDSLQRNQWESFICLVEWIIPQKQKSMHRGLVHSVFKAKVLMHILNNLLTLSEAIFYLFLIT